MLTGLGYTGYFELDDVQRPIEEFDAAQHQNPANVGDRDNDCAPRGVYVNNFAFVPKDG